MITAGVDMGAKTLKVVILDDGNVLARTIVQTGFEQAKSAEQAFDEALAAAGIKKEDVKHITATGAGKEHIVFATDQVTEIGADAKGANNLFPTVKTVIDVGAE
ncbi:MAG: hypothetical protein KAI64_07570, partial [Thermoplasmata archaeon]|nr:hypothetical protein [Thermoplasmata archaeon]